MLQNHHRARVKSAKKSKKTAAYTQTLIPPDLEATATASRENNKSERLRLQLLGDFSLKRSDGSAIPIASKKNRALLAILALSLGLHATRDRLAGLLWGDRG